MVRVVRDREGLAPRSLRLGIPFLATAKRRREDGRPLVALDTERLGVSGLAVTRRDHLRCIPLIYLLLEPVTIAARMAATLRGLSLR